MPSLKPWDTARRCAAARSTRASHSAALISSRERLASTNVIPVPFCGVVATLGRVSWLAQPALANSVGRKIILNRPQQAARQALLIGTLGQQALLGGIGQAAELDEHRGHIGCGQHGEAGGALRLFQQRHGATEL